MQQKDIKNPITTVKPSHYRFTVSDTLIRSVVHTYHPEITEPNIVYHQYMKQRNNKFGVNQIDLHKFSLLNNTVCNVQLSQKSAPRVFSLLRNSKEKLQFLQKIYFDYSDLKDS